MRHSLLHAAAVAGAGLLLGAGFVAAPAWWLVFPGFALMLFAVSRANALHSAILSGCVLGFLLYGIALIPDITATLPLDWFGITDGAFEIAAAGGAWLLAGGILAIGPAAFGALWHWYASRSAPPLSHLIVAPAAWVLAQWLASVCFGIVSAGPGTFLGSGFTFAGLGYLLANDPALLQAAWLGGIYALSFVAAGIGTLIYLAWSANGKRTRAALVIITVLLAAWLVGGHIFIAREAAAESDARSRGNAIAVAAVSRYVPPRFSVSAADDDADFESVLGEIAPLRGIGVLVLPEDTAFLRTLNDGAHAAVLPFIAQIGIGGAGPLIIDSEDIRQADGSLRSRVSYYSGPDDISYGYKQMLMPVGEYVPYALSAMIRMIGGEALLEKVGIVRAYAPGPSGGSATTHGAVFAVRFCDEVLSPSLYRADVRAGANILVNISSQSWFHGSPVVFAQMLEAARVRAVESRRWFVQSGDMSPAFALDAYGQLMLQTPDGVAAAAIADAVPRSDMTPYARAGEGVLAIPLLLLIGCAWLYRCRREPDAHQ
ncbi:MAG TPA: nitrilase-related carbon-nitrogen hydrolase [Candidatus Paceibacterota bacterium]|nr:nitrilase-related carbon-nitrogen hydrolase [Candidatus Paceibacterota bacterium]